MAIGLERLDHRLLLTRSNASEDGVVFERLAELFVHIEQVASIDGHAELFDACTLANRCNGRWVIARDHLDRHVLLSEVLKDVHRIAANLIAKFDDGQPFDVAGSTVAVGSALAARNSDEALAGGPQRIDQLAAFGVAVEKDVGCPQVDPAMVLELGSRPLASA